MIDRTVHTVSEYLAQDISKRERKVWYWPTKWYVEPYALELDEWDKLYAHLKMSYPIQHFIRMDCFIMFCIIRHKWSNVKHWCKYRLNHPRKHMMKAIFTKDYQDLDTITVNFCLESIVEYVDREKCFEHILWDDTDERIQQAAMIKEIYEYATKWRDLRGKEINLLWADVPIRNPRPNDYAVIEIKEKEIEDLDTKYCNWVISNRKHLWT